MKRIVALICILAVLFVGCGSKTGADAVKDEIVKSLSKDFSADEYSVGVNNTENALIVKFHYRGFTETIELAKSGDAGAIEKWKELVELAIDLSVAISGSLQEQGVEDMKSVIYVSDFENQSAIYLSVINGVVEYDELSTITSPWKKAYTFTSGNYVAGVDFGPGTYDIEALSGTGNVYTSDLGINAIMGNEPGMNDIYNLYEKTYRNIYIPDGVTLSIDGVKIRIVLVE